MSSSDFPCCRLPTACGADAAALSFCAAVDLEEHGICRRGVSPVFLIPYSNMSRK
jgi:hypothetical protein